MRHKREIILSILLLLLIVVFIFGKEISSVPAKLILRYHSSHVLVELTRDVRYLSMYMADFYRKNMRYPTLDEIKTGQPGIELSGIWDRWGQNRFDQENLYYSGYEDGQCTFVAEMAIKGSFSHSFPDERYYKILANSIMQIEHQWIAHNDNNHNANRTLPRSFIYGTAAVSSPCFQLIEDIEPDQYARIRKELLRLYSETGGYGGMCVFSKPFQERLKRKD